MRPQNAQSSEACVRIRARAAAACHNGAVAPGTVVTSTKERQRLGYRRIVQMLVYLIVIPNVLLLAIGILILVWNEEVAALFGILTLSLVGAMITGIVLVWVFIRREANLSLLQADFVSKVSHELRTPLTGIRLFVDTLAQGRRDEATVAQCVAALSTETDRLTQLIERLLDWGRMEAGKKQFDLRAEDVTHIVQEASKAFGAERYGDDVRFTQSIEAGLPPVFVDRHAIVDAVLNLLSNARKYGGVPAEIKLSAYRVRKGVVLEVRDSGPGIARSEQSRVFDKFYRIDDRLSRAQQGSGLGLAIVKHIARAHGGAVELESVPGHGAAFRILLPTAPPQPAHFTATQDDPEG